MVFNDAEVIAKLREVVNEPDPLEQALRHAETAPGAWPRWTLARQLWYLRKRRRLSQTGLAKASGVSQARISRLESGADAKWSTLAAVFAALGHDLLLLPSAPGSRKEGRPNLRRRPAASTGTGPSRRP